MCETCGSLTPKKSKPEVEPRTPVKEPEKTKPQTKKESVFQRMGSFLKKKSKEDSPSKK